MNLAGTPPTTLYGSTSLTTTAPAPITEPTPILTPDFIITPCPIQTSEWMTVKGDNLPLYFVLQKKKVKAEYYHKTLD